MLIAHFGGGDVSCFLTVSAPRLVGRVRLVFDYVPYC